MADTHCPHCNAGLASDTINWREKRLREALEEYAKRENWSSGIGRVWLGPEKGRVLAATVLQAVYGDRAE